MKVKGSDKPEILYGSNKADVINALGGDDTIFTAGEFPLSLMLPDRVNAGEGDDVIVDLAIDWASAKNPPKKIAQIDGGAGDDTMIVRVNNELLTYDIDFTSKTAGKLIDAKNVETAVYLFYDLMTKGKIVGGNLSEVFDVGGTGGVFKIEAGGGNDVLLGSGNGGTFDGGKGDDVIVADGRNSKITGGSGRDHFVASQYESQNFTITDFQHGTDRIIFDYDTQWLNVTKGIIAGPDMFQVDEDQFNAYVTFEKSSHALYYDGRLIAHLKGVDSVSVDDFLF